MTPKQAEAERNKRFCDEADRECAAYYEKVTASMVANPSNRPNRYTWRDFIADEEEATGGRVEARGLLK